MGLDDVPCDRQRLRQRRRAVLLRRDRELALRIAESGEEAFDTVDAALVLWDVEDSDFATVRIPLTPLTVCVVG